MNVYTKKGYNKIIVESDPFYGGVDLSHSFFERLQEYFSNQGFRTTEIDTQRLIVSKGNPFTNIIAFSMKKLRRDIIIEVDDYERISIVSYVDTTGQAIRQSEMDFFSLEVRDIIDYIQNKKDTKLSIKQKRKSTIGNYAILIAMIGISILVLFIAIYLIENH